LARQAKEKGGEMAVVDGDGTQHKILGI
jgi:hypothetical protein